MPAHVIPKVARWPSAPYPQYNGTKFTSTTSPARTGATQAAEATPISIPTAVFQAVTVVPAYSISETTTAHPEITQYPGPQAKLLQGYCSEPAYTLLDGPEIALWVPVIGCISSKSECCPTSTVGLGAAQARGAGNLNPREVDNGVQFPSSLMPAQGTLTGCPQDYHTVGSTACCPSSYWLWTSTIGGQIPCYSSLDAKMTPPPIPDTLVHAIPTASTTHSQKPTSAVVNIAYAMQYPVMATPKEALDRKVKIGAGVGASVAALLIGLLIAFLIRKFCVQKRRDRRKLRETYMAQSVGTGQNMGYSALEPTTRTYGGSKYVGVSSVGVEH